MINNETYKDLFRITSKNPHPKIAELQDGLYITLEPYIFTFEVRGIKREYKIPTGFILDLLSSKLDEKTLYSCLPITNTLFRYLNKIYNKIINIFIPSRSKYDIAALEHDFLYYIQENKQMADFLFYLRLIELGKWEWVAWDYYLVLKTFGQAAYDLNKNTRNVRIATDRTIDNLWYQGKKIDLPKKIKDDLLLHNIYNKPLDKQ